MLKSSQKGATLYFAIVIMSILLAAVFSITTIILIQLRYINKIGNSVIAYYAADSGAEAALEQGATTSPPNLSGSVGGATFETDTLASTTPECTGKYYCILSIGKFEGVERRVKVTR
jgi:hypothetical protein